MKVVVIGMSSLSQSFINEIGNRHHEMVLFHSQDLPPKELIDLINIEKIPIRDSDELIKRPEVYEADIILILSEDDGKNLLFSQILKFTHGKLLVKIDDSNLAHMIWENRRRLNIDHVINETLILSKEITHLFFENSGVPTVLFDEYRLTLSRISVNQEMDFVGSKVRDIPDLLNLNLVGLQRGKNVIVPNGDTEIHDDDKLYILGSVRDVYTFKKKHFIDPIWKRQSQKKFILYGASKYSEAIARGLLEHDADVVVIDRVRKKLRKIQAKLPEITTFRGDGLNGEFLKNIGIDEATGVVGASGAERDNVLFGLVARQAGQRNIAIIAKNKSLVDSLKIEYFTETFHANTSMIQELTRILDLESHFAFHLIPWLIQVYEVELEAEARVIGKRLSSLNLQPGFIIGGILRQGREVIPRGGTVLEEGDKVLIFTLPDTAHEVRKFIVPKPRRSILSRSRGRT